MYNILVVRNNCVKQTSLINNSYSLMVYKTCYLRFRALPSCDVCASDVSQIVYVTGALLKKARIGGIFAIYCDNDESNPRLRKQFTSLAQRHSRWQRPESNTECFSNNYTIINCLLTIFVHNYYARPIYYTNVSKCCQSLTDWSIWDDICKHILRNSFMML